MLYLYLSDNETAAIQTSHGLVGKEKIVASSRKQIPPGIIVDGLVTDQEKLLTELHDLFARAYPKPIKDKEVALIISDKQVFTRRLKVAASGKDTDISNIVTEEAKKVLPSDIGDLVNFYRVLNTSADTTRDIFYTSCSKTVVVRCARILKMLGLELVFLSAKSQVISQLLKSFIGEGEYWLYADLDNETVEYFLLDSHGLVHFFPEKLSNKSFAGKTKTILEQLEKEQGKSAVKLVVGGGG